MCLQSLGGLDLQASGTNGTRLLLALLSIEWDVQSETLACRVSRNTTLGISLDNELLAAGVNEKADEIGAHVVAREVSQSFGKVAFVEVDLYTGQSDEIYLSVEVLTLTKRRPSKSLSGLATRVPSGL